MFSGLLTVGDAWGCSVPAGMNWSRTVTGAVLGGYIIFYGQIQSWTPQLVLSPLRQSPPNKWHATVWAGVLVTCPLILGSVVQWAAWFQDRDPLEGMGIVLVGGVVYFAFVFAVNSAVHSYLVVAYSEGNKVAMNVGFYYMSNAVGRLTGTLISGALYTEVGDNVREGFATCFWASVAFAVISAVVPIFINDTGGQGGAFTCGSLTCCIPEGWVDPEKGEEKKEREDPAELEAMTSASGAQGVGDAGMTR